MSADLPAELQALAPEPRHFWADAGERERALRAILDQH